MLSEVIFGGVGSGITEFSIYVVLAVFIAGLMVGRTPEYLGKKIEAYDVKMAMLVALIFPFGDPGVHGDFRASKDSALRPSPMPGRMDCPKFCMPSRRQPAITVGLRRIEREHALVQHDHRNHHARRTAS